jgi:hypothetical protein
MPFAIAQIAFFANLLTTGAITKLALAALAVLGILLPATARDNGESTW